MASYVAIYPQPVAADQGNDPNIALGLIVDDGSRTVVLGDIPAREDVDYDIEGLKRGDPDERLRYLCRIFLWWRVEGPIPFEGTADDAAPVLNRMYFG